MIEIKTEWQPKISVVLPSYNEKENIEEAFKRIIKAVGKDLHEIIVVDDNSPDETWKIVQNHSKKNSKIKLIHRIKEKGLASALDDGVRSAKGNVVVWMDCDMGLPPEDIPRLVKRLDKYDVVIGSRYAKGGRDLRPFWRSSLSTALNWYSSFFLGSKIKDYTSGFIAIHRNVLDYVNWKREGFGEYFAEFTYKCVKKGFSVTEVGYKFKDRVNGTSKTEGLRNLFNLGMQYGTRVLKIRFG